MEESQRQSRVYETSDFMKVVRPDPAASPPPNCAICLGTCTNKCFTDCCLHQFCFQCLLQWSHIKAECPLCKQPFKSIIHNIKPNLEYEEHVIGVTERDPPDDLLLDDDIRAEYLFLPNGPRPQRQFQFRTTLTLEPGGEFAIQQLLLSHAGTNSMLLPTNRFNVRDTNPGLTFRRAVYLNGWWVDAQPDVTGRFRECSPSFFRENPAQTHRIIPWLHRELSVLLRNAEDTYNLREIIIEMLSQYPILSGSFRTRIVAYLGPRTDHFIHELYSFVRSPYDMVGYDRHVSYFRQQPPFAFNLPLSDDDSDVRVVDSPNDCIYVPPATPEIIVIHSDDSDSDVVVRTPPPTISLLDTDSDDEPLQATEPPATIAASTTASASTADGPNAVASITQEQREPQLPIKIRLKLNRNSSEFNRNIKRPEKKLKNNSYRSDSDSDSCDPKSDSEYSSAHISSFSDFSSSDESESEWQPRSNGKYAESYAARRSKKKVTRTQKSKSVSRTKSRSRKRASDTEQRCSKSRKGSKKNSKHKRSRKRESEHRNKRVKRIKREYLPSSHSERSHESSDSDGSPERKRRNSQWHVKTEAPELSEAVSSGSTSSQDPNACRDLPVAGPSHQLRSFAVKDNMLWFSRPALYDQSSDNNSD